MNSQVSSKIAVLLIAHKDSEMVKRLIARLSCPEIDVFLHIDKKSNITLAIARGGVMLVAEDEREDIRWGQNQDNRATLKLLELAVAHSEDVGVPYHHYVLLSGQDYPVRPIDHIVQHLASAPDIDFIDVLGPETRNYEDYLTRVCLYWPKALVKRDIISRSIAALYRRVGKALLSTRVVRGGSPSNNYYFGSMWWALSGRTVAWMLDAVKKNPTWISWFDHSLNPDECLFQTLFMASPAAGRQRPNLTYIDWSEGRSSPKTLRMEDFDSISASSCCFARKFDPAIDSAVLDAIDRKLLSIDSI